MNHQPRFAGFDGLRALAILLVIAWHTAVVTGFPEEAMGAARAFFMNGWAGVDLFFALSGFLITTLILREEAGRGGGRFSLRRFYLRRALRILPVFYFVFLMNTFVLARSPIFASIRVRRLAEHHSFLGLFPYATFWGNYFLAYARRLTGHVLYDPGASYQVFWSLCVEEHFYLLWPLFLTAVKGFRARLTIAGAVCVAVLALRWIAVARHFEVHYLSYHYVSHYRLDGILWGAAAALVFDRWRPPAVLRRAALAVTAGTTAALMLARSLSILPPSSLLGESLGMTALGIAAALLVLELACAPGSAAARVLEAAPLRSVGRVSYGMYLVHFAMIDLGAYLLSDLALPWALSTLLQQWLFFAALSYGVAWLIYWAIERPFLQLKDRWFAASRQPPPTAG